jgi:hypothetical protein
MVVTFWEENNRYRMNDRPSVHPSHIDGGKMTIQFLIPSI